MKLAAAILAALIAYRYGKAVANVEWQEALTEPCFEDQQRAHATMQ